MIILSIVDKYQWTMNGLMDIKLIDKINSFYHSYCVHTWLRANSLAPYGCSAIALNEHFILEMCTFNPGELAVAHIYHSVNLSQSLQRDTLQNEYLNSP